MNITQILTPWQIVADEFACEHKQTAYVRFVKSNGAVCVRIQCLRCGTNVKEVGRRGHDVDLLPEWNESIRDNWSHLQQERRDELHRQRQENFEQERQEKNAEWWAKYNQYLHSQQWYDIRQRVLDRDGGICQACLRNKASQVHHLSYVLYEQLGRSAAFELVAICYQCHKAIHPHLADAQHLLVETLYNPYLNGGKNGRN